MAVYTIGTLKHEIKDLPDDMEIFMSSDEEGNSFSRGVDLLVTSVKNVGDPFTNSMKGSKKIIVLFPWEQM